MRFVSAQFDGILQVVDVDKMHAAIANGIGSAKGFGFGLLSLAPVRG
jgi:CRISPR system Cascade subunit CasE